MAPSSRTQSLYQRPPRLLRGLGPGRQRAAPGDVRDQDGIRRRGRVARPNGLGPVTPTAMTVRGTGTGKWHVGRIPIWQLDPLRSPGPRWKHPEHRSWSEGRRSPAQLTSGGPASLLRREHEVATAGSGPDSVSCSLIQMRHPRMAESGDESQHIGWSGSAPSCPPTPCLAAHHRSWSWGVGRPRSC